MPTKAALGTDVLGLHPDTLRERHDDETGLSYVECTPLPLDVAVVHANAGDERGSIRHDPKLIWMDAEVVRAAKTTIVTVERVIPEAATRAEPWRTTFPRFIVDAVVEAPWGAYPTSCFPEYGYDGDFFRAYTAAHAKPDTAQSFWSEQVDAPESHAAFLDANGGAKTLLGIARRTM
jgi:glutaconate CoA-transferase subunit A